MIELLLEAERALAVGLLDQAERLYDQAASGDPRNAIAVVGLARVALERGDEARAFELGRRALAIDAENIAARRLVDRIREVRHHRGDTALPEPDLGRGVGSGTPEPADPGEPLGHPREPSRVGRLRRWLGRR